jgi:hypothetical protein
MKFRIILNKNVGLFFTNCLCLSLLDRVKCLPFIWGDYERAGGYPLALLVSR